MTALPPVCPHGIDYRDEPLEVVKDDGTTEVCGAYTTIFTDDGSEYCKCCYSDVTHVSSRASK